MKSINTLLPDVRMLVSGAPDMISLYMLTRVLAEFLDRTEAWQEWGAPLTLADTMDVHGNADGRLLWLNQTHDAAATTTLIKRIVQLKWNDGQNIIFKTIGQLDNMDLNWRVTTGSVPRYFTVDGESSNPAADIGGVVTRLVPIPAVDDPTLQITPLMVIVTPVHSGDGLLTSDVGNLPSMPDRIYNAFRETIVAGALAKMLVIPKRDWTDKGLAAYYTKQYEDGIVRATSIADAEYGHPDSLVAYGGY